MINSFDTEVAEVVGVVPAVLYKNIQYWCEKNQTNEESFHDGLYWTYNSISAFQKQFPYLTKNQINTALNKLVEAGYIAKGNYNKAQYDRTIWYADLKQNAFMKNQKSIYEKTEMDFGKNINVIMENHKPIPNIKSNTNSNIKTNDIERKKESYDSILAEMVKPELHDIYIEFIKMRKLIKKPLTSHALKMIIRKTNELAGYDVYKARLILNQSITNCWQGVFPLKDEYVVNTSIEPLTTEEQMLMDKIHNDLRGIT